jgi:hypothetical protein
MDIDIKKRKFIARAVELEDENDLLGSQGPQTA